MIQGSIVIRGRRFFLSPNYQNWFWGPHSPYSRGIRVLSSSSSLSATTSIAECFDLLNIQFPIIAILDAASPILYFQFLHVIS
jgi:hypothetical protein